MTNRSAPRVAPSWREMDREPHRRTEMRRMCRPPSAGRRDVKERPAPSAARSTLPGPVLCPAGIRSTGRRPSSGSTGCGPAVLLVLLVVARPWRSSAGSRGRLDRRRGGVRHPGGGRRTARRSSSRTGRQTTATVRATGDHAGLTTTPIVTPTRTVDPNATPWNAASGRDQHSEGGTHHVELSPELAGSAGRPCDRRRF